jgi:Leucine-rich repeat (LRR) protein
MFAPQVHDDISKLTGLKELDLRNNDISGLPPKLGMLDGTLRMLCLEGNPLRSIRRPVLERGTAAVLEYLQGRIPAQ